MTRHTPPHPRDIRDVAAPAPAHRRRDRYEHHGACDANRSRCHVFRPSSMRASRRALGASLRCARVAGIGFPRSRAWMVEARIAARARRRADLVARVAVMRGGVFVAAFCAVRARDAASRDAVRARVGDRGLCWRQRIAHSAHCLGGVGRRATVGWRVRGA